MAVQHKRGRYGRGYLIVALRLRGTAQPIDAITSGPARSALDAIIGAPDTSVTCEDGWLKATWEPRGLTLFPGAFHRSRWATTLESLSTIADELERTGAA